MPCGDSTAPFRPCLRVFTNHSAHTARGEIEMVPNVGLQLVDVVLVADARVGMSSDVYRVRGMEEVCVTTKGPLVLEKRVGLGARDR